MLERVSTSVKNASTGSRRASPPKSAICAGVITLVEHAHHGEQPAGGQPVVDHLQHAALDAQPVERRRAPTCRSPSG